MKSQSKKWNDPVLVAAVAPLAVVMLVFFLVPLVMTAILTFQTTQYYRLNWTWDLKIWTEIFSKPHYWTIMFRTVWMAVVCVVISLLIAFPAAYALTTRLKTYSAQIQILIIFAFLTDAVLKTFGWILVLDRNGVANWLLSYLGFGPEALDILFTPTGTMIGMVYNLAVYPMFTIYLSLARIDRDLVLASYDAWLPPGYAPFSKSRCRCRGQGFTQARCLFLSSVSAPFWSRRCWAAGRRHLLRN